jgi:uncharacterized membrane protein YhaH (DUF805 family)
MEWMILPYKRYADFEGRSRRLEYWMFQLFNGMVMAVIIAFAIAGLPLAMFSNPAAFQAGAEQPGLMLWVAIALAVFWLLASFIPSIAVVVRRLHDRDMSGWWYLGFIVLQIIPFVGWIASIAFFVITVLPGTDGPNRFGPDPLDPSQADVFA